MSGSKFDKLAALLVDQSAQIPPRIDCPDELRPVDLDEGYEVQKRFEALRPASERAAGYKVACMTKRSQALNHVPEAVFGGLRGDSVLFSGAQLAVDKYVKLLIECEIVAIVDFDAHGAHAIRSLAPSMEINDFRCLDRSAEVIIVDNWNNAGTVLGPFMDGWNDDLFVDASAYVIVDGEKVVERRVREVIGNPRRTVDWLIPALRRRGRKTWSGMLVSTGSLCGEIFIHKDQRVVAGITGLGEVTITTI